MPALPTGKVSFSVEAEGHPRHELPYELAGESESPVVLQLQRGGQVVHGRVVNGDGDALIGAQVDLRSLDGNDAPIDAFVYTDDKGEFRFSKIPVGEFSLEAWTDQGSREVTVRSGGPATVLVIEF